MKSKQEVEKYQKLSAVEHILLRSETYIGSIEPQEKLMWIINEESRFEEKKTKYIPGLYKIFDEILVNAADNMRRDHRMTSISVTINEETGEISVYNDGKSIPVQIHREHKVYIAQMIFGHLHSSSNFDDSEKRVTGGRNGYGAKLANIFSTKFTVQTADSSHRKLLKIQWMKNMSIMSPPEIIGYQGKNFTRVSFIPDFQKFKISRLSAEMIGLIKKRVYDMAGILKCKVFLNESLIQINSFEEYCRLYGRRHFEEEEFFIDEAENSKRWEVIIGKSDGQFQQISYVNGLATIRGGTHINYIMDQLVQKIEPLLLKKRKDLNIKPYQIKSHFKIFVNCLIENPVFDGQTKEYLTLKSSSFGSTYEVSDKMIKSIMKSGIVQKILADVKSKESQKFDKLIKKNTKISNRLVIPKLEDANLAGKSNKCVLILTEGDSAKALAMSGVENLGRDYYGVFPLRGKPLNVRQCSNKMIMDNHELCSIVKILGLNFTKTYTNVDALRYGSVMIMADQDIDGSHIKGLILNFFHTFWPSLCKIKGFLKEFVTPIIRCKRGVEKVDFFSQKDYQVWKVNETTDWKIKYYKGLGTSTNEQAKQYFSNIPKHEITFEFKDEEDDESFLLAFLKQNAEKRKRWLSEFDPMLTVDYNRKTLKINDFFNQQFVHFSSFDNIRSISSVVDGFKPSQRKILFSCFKRNLKNQIKVAQLAGYIAEHSAYHHGEISLCQAIINLAQNYVGSNNLNLLEPIGQFGTRHLNGKDHASARYIFTSLNPLTRYLFNEADDHIVEYFEEEGQTIEPKYYYPILPLVLINGCQGIGTGWSSFVPQHKVDDIIDIIRERLKGDYKHINIGWENYHGEIRLEKKGVYSVKGRYEIDGENVIITEIPISKSIRDFKNDLQTKVRSLENPDPQIEDIRQYHKGDKVEFVLTFVEGRQPNQEDLEKYLKLESKISQTNMTLFNSKGKIERYETIADIIEEFYHVRINAYSLRKQYLISRFEREQEIVESKINFINDVMRGKFQMMTSKQSWSRQLFAFSYKKYHQFTKIKSTKISEKNEEEDSNKQYNYLLGIPIWNICKQKITELQRNYQQIKAILKYYRTITEKEMWEKDLNEFEEAWHNYMKGKQIKENKNAKRIPENSGRGKIRRQPRKRSMENENEQIQLQSLQSSRKKLLQKERQCQSNLKTRKLLKKDRQAEQNKPEFGFMQQKSEKKQEKHIDSLVSKYLGSSLKERIEARIAKGDKDFMQSYNAAKNQEKLDQPKQPEQPEDDWLE